MTIEKCIAQAKQDIFTFSTKTGAAASALNFARNYFEPLIIEAEMVLQKMCIMTESLKICLLKAFDVYKHKSLTPYGDNISIIRECARRFEERYSSLVIISDKSSSMRYDAWVTTPTLSCVIPLPSGT